MAKKKKKIKPKIKKPLQKPGQKPDDTSRTLPSNIWNGPFSNM